MNKPLLVAALAAACGVFAAPVALAQQAATTRATGAQATTATAGPTTATPATTQRAVPPVDSRMCVRDTGSHLPPPKGQCLPVNGQSFTQQDINRTGAANLGQALRTLSTSVQVSGH